MKNEQKNALYSFYGTRYSKNGDRVNISLIRGEEDKKEYACISLKKDNKNIQIKTDKEGNEFLFVKIKFMQEFEKSKKTSKSRKKEEVVEDDDALPFN